MNKEDVRILVAKNDNLLRSGQISQEIHDRNKDAIVAAYVAGHSAPQLETCPVSGSGAATPWGSSPKRGFMPQDLPYPQVQQQQMFQGQQSQVPGSNPFLAQGQAFQPKQQGFTSNQNSQFAPQPDSIQYQNQINLYLAQGQPPPPSFAPSAGQPFQGQQGQFQSQANQVPCQQNQTQYQSQPQAIQPQMMQSSQAPMMQPSQQSFQTQPQAVQSQFQSQPSMMQSSQASMMQPSFQPTQSTMGQMSQSFPNQTQPFQSQPCQAAPNSQFQSQQSVPGQMMQQGASFQTNPFSPQPNQTQPTFQPQQAMIQNPMIQQQPPMTSMQPQCTMSNPVMQGGMPVQNQFPQSQPTMMSSHQIQQPQTSQGTMHSSNMMPVSNQQVQTQQGMMANPNMQAQGGMSNLLSPMPATTMSMPSPNLMSQSMPNMSTMPAGTLGTFVQNQPQDQGYYPQSQNPFIQSNQGQGVPGPFVQQQAYAQSSYH